MRKKPHFPTQDLIFPSVSPTSSRVLDKLLFINSLTDAFVRRAGLRQLVTREGAPGCWNKVWSSSSWPDGCILLACPLQVES